MSVKFVALLCLLLVVFTSVANAQWGFGRGMGYGGMYGRPYGGYGGFGRGGYGGYGMMGRPYGMWGR